MQEFKAGDIVVITRNYGKLLKDTELTIKYMETDKAWARCWFEEVDCFAFIDDIKLKDVGKPRPHAALIIKWANDTSVEIEYKGTSGNWYSTAPPCWGKNTTYREKVKDAYKDADALAVVKAKEELAAAIAEAPTTATHIYGGVFYKEGNLYALYYQKGWRESATLSNRKLLSEGTEVNVI